MGRRVFLIVLDSVGIGNAPDAVKFGDEGSNTLLSISKNPNFNVPTLKNLGLFNIDGIDYLPNETKPVGSYARLQEKSMGKDTTIGHWEMTGIISEKPFPTYPNGFPSEIIKEFENRTGRKVLCNKPYSGTQVILDYGKEHEKSGAFIVYTSADSVFQIAAHEEIIPLNELYDACKIAREILMGKNAVARVIARPFIGNYPNYTRTANRHDFSLLPPDGNLLDLLQKSGLSVKAIGKIHDIFAGKNITNSIHTINNHDGMLKTIDIAKADFEGLCFVNLVDFDMVYGHRNNTPGYAKAISEFDTNLIEFNKYLLPEDIVIITADHGCDPDTPSTDHSRECVPMLIYGNYVKSGINLGTILGFDCIASTILDIFNIPNNIKGKDFWPSVKKNGI